MVVFISCVKKKQDCECRAEEMYTSDLFKKSLQYAKQLKPRKIYILSALYGVLELDDVITPYNVTLVTSTESERKVWAEKVRQQLIRKGFDFNEETVFLCGQHYRKHLVKHFTHATAPLSRLGIGQQLAFYKENIKQ